MNLETKGIIYRRMFVISTVCGVLGVYLLFKHYIVPGWILVGIWAVLAIIVRVLIMKDKKLLKDKKI